MHRLHRPAYVAAEDTIEEWVAEVDRRGVGVAGDRLRPPSDARTVTFRDGQMRVAEGPYAQTEDHIAGFDLLDCADLDEAIELAARHPMARFGRIEVRPIWPLGG